MSIEAIEIYRDYSSSTFDDVNTPIGTADNNGYRYITDDNPNTLIKDGVYFFEYKPPATYPESIAVYISTSGIGTLPSLNINNSNLDVIGSAAWTAIPFSSSGWRYNLTPAQTKSMFGYITDYSVTTPRYSNIFNGSLNLGSSPIKELAINFEGTRSRVNNETPTGDIYTVRPNKFNSFSVGTTTALNLFISSGTDVVSVIRQPSSGIDTDVTYFRLLDDVKTSFGNYLSPTKVYNFEFDDITEIDSLSIVEKTVLRVRAKVPSYTTTNNQHSLLHCIACPKKFNIDQTTLIKRNPLVTNLNLTNRPIMFGAASDVVGSGFQNYDIDFSFVDPYSTDADGFTYYKKYDSLALLNNSDFYLYGLASGIEISSVEMMVYTANDSQMPLFTQSKVVFEKDRSSYFTGLSYTSDSNNLLYIDSDYERLFNDGYYDFRESSGSAAWNIQSTNFLKYYNGLLPSYGDFEWISNYKEINVNTITDGEAVYVNASDNSYIEFENQPNLGEEFLLYIDFDGTDINNNSLSSNDSSLIFIHRNDFIKEIEIYRNELTGYYICNIHPNGSISPVSMSIGPHLFDKKSYRLGLMKTRNATTTNNSDYFFFGISDESSFIDQAFLFNINHTSFSDSRSYFFGGWSDERGKPEVYVNAIGISTSGWDSTDLNYFVDSRISIGKLLNGENSTSLNYTNISKNLNIKTSFNNTSLYTSNPGLYQQDLYDYAYNTIAHNISGFSLEYQFDNLTTRPVLISGIYNAYSYSAGGATTVHCSGILPSGLNQTVRLHAYESFIAPQNITNSSSDSLTTFISTIGSGTYNVDLTWKKASILFDSWNIPFTGLDEIDLYTNGRPYKSDSLDLYLYNNIEPSTVDFYTLAKESQTSNINLHLISDTEVAQIDLSIVGSDTDNNDLDLFLNSATKITSGIDLYINGVAKSSSVFNLYQSGTLPETYNDFIDFTTRSSTNSSLIKSIDFSTYSNLDPSLAFNMYISSEGSGYESFNMFIEHSNLKSYPVDMFLANNNFSIEKELNMYMEVPGSGYNDSFNMFIERDGVGNTHAIDFMIPAGGSGVESIDMYTYNSILIGKGADIWRDSFGEVFDEVFYTPDIFFDFYMKGSGYIVEDQSINMRTHGF